MESCIVLSGCRRPPAAERLIHPDRICPDPTWAGFRPTGAASVTDGAECYRNLQALGVVGRDGGVIGETGNGTTYYEDASTLDRTPGESVMCCATELIGSTMKLTYLLRLGLAAALPEATGGCAPVDQHDSNEFRAESDSIQRPHHC
jgi:hypothetical protein